MWIAWYFVVVGWYFFWCCCCWCCHIKFLIKSSLTPFFRMFIYVLLKFDWLIIFFLENPPRKLKILNFFFLSSFSAQYFKCHDCACSFLKSGGIFCQRGNFNWMENDLYKKKHIVLRNVDQMYIANLRNFLSNFAKISVFQNNS